MKKLIYTPVPEQQIIYIDGEIAVINNDKVIYLKVNELQDMTILYSIIDSWNLGTRHIEDIINSLLEIYDQEKKNR